MSAINERVSDEIENLRDKAVSLYKPPFRFEHGYILDAESRIVADNDVEDADGAALRVRGWGRIGHMENAEALQDEVGNVIALAMTEFWQQQYRAAAEPVYQYQAFTFVENSDGEQEKFWFWSDCDERFYTACKGTKRVLYAAPQVTSVPDDAFERALSVLNDTLDDCGDSERGLLLALDRMGIEVAGAAPAVQAEQLSGNIEHVSQPYTLTFDQWLSQQAGEIDVDCGCVTTEAFFHWLRVAYEAGNYPAIPDGWIPVSERMPDETQPVIVVADGGVVQRTVYQFCDGVWIDWYEQYDEVPHDAFTHWMRLPAAPKQEAE